MCNYLIKCVKNGTETESFRDSDGKVIECDSLNEVFSHLLDFDRINWDSVEIFEIKKNSLFKYKF